MSSELRLGPVSYLVLGIVSLRGPTTPYELKRFVRLSIGHFWPFPHTQLYAEPARLAEAGLLDETREESGRRRRHYSLTESGRQRFAEWLAEPATSPTEIRDFGLLKLFFGELADPEDMVALAREQAAAHRARIGEYDAIRTRFADRPEFAKRLLSAELGIRISRAAADFWDEIAAGEATEAAELVTARRGRAPIRTGR